MSAQSDRFRVLRRLTEIRFEDELRGYSKNQVDRVLETLVPLADDVDQLQAKLAEAERRVASAEARLLEQAEIASSNRQVAAPVAVAPSPPVKSAAAPSADFDETLRKTLMLAQQTADTVVREASEEAERVRSSARSEADKITSSSRVEAELVLAESEASRSAMFVEVEQERDTLLQAARDTAERQIEAIEAELATAHESQREELIVQISELQQIRDLLADDIENFEAYLAERREIVRSAMSEINVVLDDPARIRPSIPPQASMIDAVNPDAYAPIKVEIASLAEYEQVVAETQIVADTQIVAETPTRGPGNTQPASVAPTTSTPATDELPTSASAVALGSDTAEASTVDVSAGRAKQTSATDQQDADASLLSALSRTEDPSVDHSANDGSEKGLASSQSRVLDSETMSTVEADHDSENQPTSLVDSLKPVDDRSTKSDITAQPSGIVEPNPDAAGPPTEAVQIISELGDAEPSVSDPWAGADKAESVANKVDASQDVSMPADEVERPAWAEAVPNVDEDKGAKSEDPFLDELRKATSSEDDDDEALSQFLSDDLKESSRGGWFGRRR